MPIWWFAFVGLIAVGGFLSSARAADPGASVGITLRLVVVTGVLPLLCWLLLRDERDLVRAAAALAIAGAVQGSAAMLQLFGVQSALFGTQRYGRFTGFAGHPNDLGAALAITLPISLISLFLFARRRLVLPLFLVGFLLNIAGLVLSGSLSAIAGGVAGVIASLMVMRSGNRWSKKWTWYGVASLLAAGLILAPLIRPGSSLGTGTRFSAIKDPRTRITEVVGGKGTLATRLETVDAAFEEIADNPIVGSGFDRESSDVFAGRQVHSMPVLAWQGGGLLVLAGLFGIIWLSLIIVRPGRRPMTARLRAIRAALLGATCAMIVNGLAQPFLYKRFGWIPVALVFSPPILSRAPSLAIRRRLESHGSPAEPAPMAGAHP